MVWSGSTVGLIDILKVILVSNVNCCLVLFVASGVLDRLLLGSRLLREIWLTRLYFSLDSLSVVSIVLIICDDGGGGGGGGLSMPVRGVMLRDCDV